MTDLACSLFIVPTILSVGPNVSKPTCSKKLSEGISGLVMDVKTGRGALMKTRERSRELADSLVKVGTANDLKVSTFITAMDAPLGRYVGNSLEVIESIEALKGNGPTDLTELSVKLAARMVKLARRSLFTHFKDPERARHAQMHQKHVARGEVGEQILGAASEPGDGLSVHRHHARSDQLLGMPPRSHSGARNNLLQSLEHIPFSPLHRRVEELSGNPRAREVQTLASPMPTPYFRWTQPSQAW